MPDRLLAGRIGDKLPLLQVFECRHLFDRGQPVAAQRPLVLRGHIGEEREVVVLGRPAHAELVEHAAVALVVEDEGEVLEGRLGDARGGRGIAGDQIGHGPEIALSVLHGLQIPDRLAQQRLGCRGLRLQGRGIVPFPDLGRSPIEDRHSDGLVRHPVLGEQGGHHLVVEGYLQPVLDPGGDGALHVGDEEMKPPLPVAPRVQDVDIAAEEPLADGRR